VLDRLDPCVQAFRRVARDDRDTLLAQNRAAIDALVYEVDRRA
jgi:hypothetical protein